MNTLKITPQEIEGPYYRADLPFRNVIAPANALGEKLVLKGTVYCSDKTPLSNTLIEIWHADRNGEYDNTSMDYLYRGKFYTNEQGDYQFETILPGRYFLDTTYRPRHIHAKITKVGYQSLITQIYFKGDPYIIHDPVHEFCPINPDLIIALKKENKHLTGVFDIVLAKK